MVRTLWKGLRPSAQRKKQTDGFPTRETQSKATGWGDLHLGKAAFPRSLRLCLVPAQSAPACSQIPQPPNPKGRLLAESRASWSEGQRLCEKQTQLSLEAAAHQPCESLCYSHHPTPGLPHLEPSRSFPFNKELSKSMARAPPTEKTGYRRELGGSQTHLFCNLRLMFLGSRKTGN